MLSALYPLLLLVAYGGPALLEPAPAAAPVSGDADGDGAADISDAVYLQNMLFRSGPEVRCSLVADVLPDGILNRGDSMLLLSAVLPGDSKLPLLAEGVCGAADPSAVPEPALLGLSWEAPKRATGTTEAILNLETRDRPVQAWSMTLEATGCTVAELSTDGTAADWAYRDPPGKRASTSYDFHRLTATGAEVGVVLDWQGDQKLTVEKESWPILKLGLEPTGGECGSCTVRVLAGRGEGRVDSVTTLNGWSFPLPGAEATI
jgi:hypothetical protein